MGIADDPFIVRNLVYGMEDSLVSTTGVVVGMYYAGMDRRTIVITGAILVLVEAMSMGYGAFLAEESFLRASKTTYTARKVATYSVVMFVSYALAGIVPLLPFLAGSLRAHVYSMLAATCALYALIWKVKADVTKAVLMTGIGASLIAASSLTGHLLGVAA